MFAVPHFVSGASICCKILVEITDIGIFVEIEVL